MTRADSQPLLTYDQAIELLRQEVDSAKTATEVAEKYGIKRQRLSDILTGRQRLSGEALTKLKFELEMRYRRVG